MSDYVTKIRTRDGDKKIDYNGLANLPDIPSVDESLLNQGDAADSKIVGEKFTKLDQEIEDINNKSYEKLDVVYNETNNSLVFQNTPELPDNVYVDKTLTESGNAADAKVTGDAISELKGDLSDKLPKSPADWEAWTAEEQAVARERMGIPGDYELIETIALTDEVSEIIRDTDTLGNQYSMKNLLLSVSAGSTTLKMFIRITINGKYIIETESIGDNAYSYNYVCRFDINNGILSTFLIGNRGTRQNRYTVNSSIDGMTTFLDTIKKVKLSITNPIEGATIKIYGVRA